MAQETPEQKIARLEAENEAKQRLIDDQNGIISDQAEVIANAETAQAEEAVVVVTYDKQQYRVLARSFQLNGKVVKASELGQDKESLKALVESKSGILQKVEKATKATPEA